MLLVSSSEHGVLNCLSFSGRSPLIALANSLEPDQVNFDVCL